MALGDRDPEDFAKRYAFGVSAVVLTNWLLRLSGADVRPLDLPNFKNGLAAYSWSDFARRPANDPQRPKTPDLFVQEGNGKPCMVEISRRNFVFLLQDPFGLSTQGVSLEFHQGSPFGFEKLEQQYVLSAAFRPTGGRTTLDDFYSALWEEIQSYLDRLDSGNFSGLDLEALLNLCRPREMPRNRPVARTTFFVRDHKLDEWGHSMSKNKIDPMKAFYVMWGSNLDDGFLWCPIGEILRLAQAGELSKGKEGTSDERTSFLVPIRLLKGMDKFPLFPPSFFERVSEASPRGFRLVPLAAALERRGVLEAYLQTFSGIGPSRSRTIADSLIGPDNATRSWPERLESLANSGGRAFAELAGSISRDLQRNLVTDSDDRPFLTDDRQFLLR